MPLPPVEPVAAGDEEEEEQDSYNDGTVGKEKESKHDKVKHFMECKT